MATKVKTDKRRSVKKAQNGSNQSTKILGIDVKTLGTAVAAAVVGEIAQAAINRSAKALSQDDQVDQMHETVEGSVSPIRAKKANLDSDSSSKGATQGVAGLVKDVLQEIKPVIIDAVSAAVASAAAAGQTAEGGANAVRATTVDVADRFGNTVDETIDTAKDSAVMAKQSLQTKADDVVGVVRNALEEIKTPDKNKKNKKKSGKHKGSKKNKK